MIVMPPWQAWALRGVPWSLASIPDLAAWWRLDAGVTTVSGAVSSIASQGGLGYPLVQANVSDRPTYEATGWADGGPSMLLDGTSDYMAADSLVSIANGADSPFTIIILGQWVTTGADRYISQFGNTSTATPFHGHTLAAGTLAQRVYRRDNASAQVNVAGSTAANTNRSVLSQIFTGTELTVLVNGASVGVDAAACNVGTITFDMFTIGAARYAATISSFANYRIAEIAVWGRALSNSEENDARTDMVSRRSV